MVIYIESVFAFNVLVDYLLLFGAARVAGRTVARRRLLLGAAVGGIYAAVQLFLPKSVVLLLLGLALMGAAAYRGSGRAVKLTLLFFLASCGLAGVVMLLGQSLGSMARLARGVVTADLPWGVFLIAAGTSYLLLSVVFRCGAARTGSETADVVIVRAMVTGRKSVALHPGAHDARRPAVVAVLLAVLVIGMTVFGILRYDSAAFSAQSHGEAKQGHEIEGGTAVQGEDNDRD